MADTELAKRCQAIAMEVAGEAYEKWLIRGDVEAEIFSDGAARVYCRIGKLLMHEAMDRINENS